MSDDPNVYERDGRVYYRASALGGCLKSLALARQGYDPMPPTAASLELFAGGHEAEKKYLESNRYIQDTQRVIKLQVAGKLWVVGHIDGTQHDRIIEIKSQSDEEFAKPSIRDSFLWHKYSYQFSAYMLALDMPLWCIRVRRSDREVNREEFYDPPVDLAAIRTRLFNVERLALKEELAKEQCDVVSYPCPFFYTHEDEARELVDDDAALVLAKEVVRAGKAAKIESEKASVARKALLTWMGDKSKVELGEGWKVTTYETKGGERKFTVKPSRGVRVTPPKEIGEDGEDHTTDV